MAHRVLHYCTEQICYECNEEFLTEDGICEKGRLNGLFPNGKPIYSIELRRSRFSADHVLWYRVLWDYGKRRLSKPSDKLPALSGLAQIFSSRIQAEYVAGLWSNALIEGLAWQGLASSRDPTAPSPSAYIAPSWSWASYNGIAATGQTENWKEIAAVLDYDVKLKGENPYGELLDGWIRVRGPLLPLSLSDVPETEEEKLRQAAIRLRTVWGKPFDYHAIFDSIDQRDEGARDLVTSLELFGLMLAQTEKHIEENGSIIYY
jgi:hypothetical protein